MKLRSRQAAHISFLTELAQEEESEGPPRPVHDSQYEEYHIEEDLAPFKAHPTPKRRRTKPGLIELVLSTLGIRDIFDVQTLRNLRASCKEFKTLIDNLKILVFYRIASRDDWAAFIAHPTAMQRVSSLDLYYGQVSPSDATELLVRNPRLTRLIIQNAGLAGDVLAFASFQQLTCLRLEQISRGSKILHNSSNDTTRKILSWPLKELVLSGEYSNLMDFGSGDAAALTSFSSTLTKLSLGNINFSNTKANTFSKDMFPVLKEICIADVSGHDEIKFLEKCALPALKVLTLRLDKHWRSNDNDFGPIQKLADSIAESEYLPHIQSLDLKVGYRTTVTSWFSGTLSGTRALKTLSLDFWSGDGENHGDLYQFLNLPCLEALTIIENKRRNSEIIMGKLAKARLPELQKLTFGTHDEAGFSLGDDARPLEAFIDNLSCLISLTIIGPVMTGESTRHFANLVLPRLEEFSLQNGKMNLNHFLPPGENAASSVLLPKLKTLSITIKERYSGYRGPSDGLLSFARRSGKLVCFDVPCHVTSAEVSKFAAESARQGLWPHLESIHKSLSNSPARVKALLKTWPKLSS